MTPTPRKLLNGTFKWIIVLIPLIVATIYGYGRLNSNVEYNTADIKENSVKIQANAHEIAVVAKGIMELQNAHAIDSVKYIEIKDDLQEIKELIKAQ